MLVHRVHRTSIEKVAARLVFILYFSQQVSFYAAIQNRLHMTLPSQGVEKIDVQKSKLVISRSSSGA